MKMSSEKRTRFSHGRPSRPAMMRTRGSRWIPNTLLLLTLILHSVQADTAEPTDFWTWMPSETYWPSTLYPTDTTLAPETYLIQRPSGKEMEYPATRYTYWKNLTETEQEAAKDLRYDSYTWERVETCIAEQYYWDDLPERFQEDAQLLGFDQFTWDCYQHHYFWYNWFELEYMEVSQYFSVLGYDEQSWNEDMPPASKFKDWAELTSEEQDAAASLCWFRETWERDRFSRWEDQSLLNQGLGTPVPSASPTEIPSTGPTPAPTEETQSPSSSPTTSSPSSSPTATTPSPSSTPSATPTEATPSPSSAPTEATPSPSSAPTEVTDSPTFDPICTDGTIAVLNIPEVSLEEELYRQQYRDEFPGRFCTEEINEKIECTIDFLKYNATNLRNACEASNGQAVTANMQLNCLGDVETNVADMVLNAEFVELCVANLCSSKAEVEAYIQENSALASDFVNLQGFRSCDTVASVLSEIQYSGPVREIATLSPSMSPSTSPSSSPSSRPTYSPSSRPTSSPSSGPTSGPSSSPTQSPTVTHSFAPTPSPTRTPSATPTNFPSDVPSNLPSLLPSSTPTISMLPTVSPQPSANPTFECIDDPETVFEIGSKSRNCGWVAILPTRRCESESNEGIVLSELCPAACGIPCEEPSSTPSFAPTTTAADFSITRAEGSDRDGAMSAISTRTIALTTVLLGVGQWLALLMA